MLALIPFPEQFTIEAHAQAATVHLHGDLTVAGALRALDACRTLPMRVQTLIVDLRGVTAIDAQGLATLHHLLRRWRDGRGGTIRVLPPVRRAA
jgi:ABC-type transporter Mla MlaB component